MKRLIISLAIMAFGFGQLNAQGLKEKLNAKIGGSAAGGEITFDVSGTGNQYEEAVKFINGEKRTYLALNAEGKFWNDLEHKFYTEQFEKSLEKDASGNVIKAKSFGINDPKDPLYFNDNRNYNEGVLFVNGSAHECSFDWESLTVTDVRCIHTSNKLGFGKTLDKQEVLTMLNEYLKKHRGGYDSRIVERENARKAEEAARKEKESIEGLSVKSIRLFFDNNEKEILYNQRLAFSVEATLADGKKKITPGSSSYASAYNFEIEGVDKRALSGGTVHQNYYYCPTDVIKVKVSLKSNPAIKSEATLVMNHDAVVFAGTDKFSFGSRHISSTSWAGKAPDARVEIKQVKHAVTGESLIAYKVFFGSSSEPNFWFKTKADQYVKVHADAANSSSSSNVSSTDRGYSAGDIKVIKDPSVPASINFVTSAKGGTTKGTNGISSMPGLDGKIETVTAKVSW